MAQITRSTKIGGGTTLSANTLARAADVETDILSLFTAHNNHDSGATSWTVVSASGTADVPLVTNNSSGTQNIFEAKDNGSTVFSIADGGGVTATGLITGNGGATLANATTVPLVANNSSGTQDIVQFKDNGSTVWSIADGGNLVSATKKITGLAAGSANGDSVRFEQLKVIQIVTASSTTSFTTTSTTFTNTNLSCAITPTSSSNKIIVIAVGTLSISNASGIAYAQIDRSGYVGTSDGQFQLNVGGGDGRTPMTLIDYDTPATTSALTYRLTIRSNNSSYTAGFGHTSNEEQRMILIEVA
jgi:hypothetical protein